MHKIFLYKHSYDSSQDLVDLLSDQLTSHNIERLNTMKALGAQNSYASSRALLNLALTETLDMDIDSIVIEPNSDGKPEIVQPTGSRWKFNISHTKGLSVVAISQDYEVGVDVESSLRKQRHLDLSKRFFHPDEYQSLCTISNKEEQMKRFFSLWTAKEAYLKALGKGLSKPLGSFCVTIDDGQGITIEDFAGDLDKHVFSSSLTLYEHYCCTVIALSEQETPMEIVQKELLL